MPYLQETFEEQCRTTGAPTQLSFFSATISVIFLVLNIPGNLLLITAVAMDPHKNLRTPFNYLMANLAVADLIVGVVTDPLSISYHMKEGLDTELPVGEIRSFHMSYFISCTASVLSLASLAVERYFATWDPYTYRTKFTGRRILLTVGCIWLIALSLPFVYFEVDFITCAFILVNTTVVIAIGVTCFTYGMMVYKFKQYAKDRKAIALTAIKNSSTVENSSPDNFVLWQRRITKMFLLVMVALLCCYGPATVLIYVMSFCETCSCTSLHWFRDLQFLLVIMNSNVNFFCYALRSARYRRAFSYILKMMIRD